MVMLAGRRERCSEPEEAAGRLTREQSEVLSAHHAIEADYTVRTECVRYGTCGQTRDVYIVDHGRIAFVQHDVEFATHRFRDTEPAIQRIAQHIARVILEVTDRSTHTDTLRQHVLGEAALNRADGQRTLRVR